MSKFRFRLQKVMEVKQHREEELQRALALTRRALREECSTLETLRTEQNVRFREAEQEGTGEIHPTEMQLHSVYLEALERRIVDQQTMIEQLREEEEHRRSYLLEASKEKKILEELRDRKYVAFRTEMDRAEGTFLDEVGQQGYIGEPIPADEEA